MPCTGNNLRARNPLTGEILAAGSSTLVGTKVASSAANNPGLFLAGTGPVPDSTFLYPTMVYGPRFGAAYDLSGTQRTVIRGGAGVYFDRPFGTAGPIGQPPTALSSTLTNDLLTNVRPGAGTSSELSVSNITSNQLNSKIATSLQYNAGVQMTLPWAMVLDLAYAGSYNYNESATADINGLTFGSLYLPANQDPTKAASASTGVNALATNLIRPLQGYGQINQAQFVNWNRFNSLQASLNRRFKNGVQFNVNYTYGKNYGTDGQGVRVDPDGKGGVTIRADQAELETVISAGATGSGSSDQTHVARVNFVWDLPDLSTGTAAQRAIGYVLNDWQLSGVWNAASGIPYSLGYTYNATGSPTGNQLTGSPNYVAKILLNGDTGSGCSSDPTRQFKTDSLAGPQFGSLGLESKNNTLRGCKNQKVDLAVARLFRLKGGRTAQVRIEAYNAFNTVNYNNRVTSATFASITDRTTIVNLPYDAAGALVATRAPGLTGAGLGAVTSAAAMRVVQGQIRFSF